jgi:D-beta-D-heptose 7-phosphate kinase/D-beta-D-heptose 1-phosphate adenosyltransferase
MTEATPVQHAIPDFGHCRVLVVGDVMLDRYWRGETGRVSPEAPVPVVRFERLEERPGGAANVAANLAMLGAHTRLLGVTGLDEEGARLARLVAGLDIEFERIGTAEVPTTAKQRIVSRSQQLIRLDTEVRAPESAALRVLEAFRMLLDDVDLVVLSDYDKGTLAAVEQLIDAARTRNVPVLVDPKGSDFARYSGATALTPNLSEFEAVAGAAADDDSLVRAARAQLQALALDFLLVTRSERGMSLVAADGAVHHLPTRAREVFDVTGAGDTVIATLAAGLAAGLDPVRAAQLANVAAGVVVRRIGVAGVTPAELQRGAYEAGVCTEEGAGEHKDRLLNASRAVAAVSDAKARGERVVMTNGCFDVLHAGHVNYLQAASTLGARLLVAVNDDESVRRLKGEGRPINPLEDRLAVLLALGCVDWVVPFAEDTPQNLICAVLPDVLVKGGDYSVEQIAGGDCVRRAGGEVRVLPLLEGRSTSAVIQRMRTAPARD